MKKGLVFILGIIVGWGTLLLILIIFSYTSMLSSPNNGTTTLFPEAGECISQKPFKVFQTLDQGSALAKELSDRIGGEEMFYGVNVLFTSEGKHFYDEEIIRVPKGKCVRQIGVYKYSARNGNEQTVPVVKISDK